VPLLLKTRQPHPFPGTSGSPEPYPSDQDMGFTMVSEAIGPRVLELEEKPHEGPSLRSVDFTPAACHLTKRIDTSLDDASRYAIRHAKLADAFPERHTVWWAFSEDNVLAFTVCLRGFFGQGAQLFTVL
jgi:hypothetical protein